MKNTTKPILFTLAALIFAVASFVALLFAKIESSILFIITGLCFWMASVILQKRESGKMAETKEVPEQQPIEAQAVANDSERMFNAIKRIKIIARGMFEANLGKWHGANYHVFVRIQPGCEFKKGDDLSSANFSHVMFSEIGRDWQITGITNVTYIDIDYMESFDKIDRT